jgi:hypothetical protein
LTSVNESTCATANTSSRPRRLLLLLLLCVVVCTVYASTVVPMCVVVVSSAGSSSSATSSRHTVTGETVTVVGVTHPVGCLAAASTWHRRACKHVSTSHSTLLISDKVYSENL